MLSKLTRSSFPSSTTKPITLLTSRPIYRSNHKKYSFTNPSTPFHRSFTMSSFKAAPVEFLPTGAIIQSFNVAGTNIVLGFPSEKSYIESGNRMFTSLPSSLLSFSEAVLTQTHLSSLLRRNNRPRSQPHQQRQNRLPQQRQILLPRSQRRRQDQPPRRQQRLG